MDGQIVNDNELAIDIRHLSVTFGRKKILNRVCLNVPLQKVTVIIGPSGSGKTTLLRAINRLNECFSACRTEGSVRLRYENKWVDAYHDAVPLQSLRREAAMVLQNPNVLPTSIENNFSIPLKAALRLSRKEIQERMRRALGEVELYNEVHDRLHGRAVTLSGGQQQRLCLARALAMKPTYLLLDEPTANLDYRATRTIEHLLARLKRHYTILAVSHSLGQTRRIADHVVLLREGEVVRTFDRAQLRDESVFQSLVEDVF